MMLQTAHMEGPRAVYKGVWASAAGMGVYLAASFWAYDELTGALPARQGWRLSDWHALGKMGAGAAAGVLGQVGHC